MIEKWKEIKDFSGYFVSTAGKVKNSHGQIMSNEVSNAGYNRVHLCKNGKAKHLSVHRLVAKAFISNPNNLRVVNHKNGIKTDNRVENLEWSTHSANLQHAYDFNLRVGNFGEANGQAKLTRKKVEEIRTLYKKQSKKYGSYALAKIYNVSSSTILHIVKNKKWS